MEIRSIDDNKKYKIDLPEQNQEMNSKFENLVNEMRVFNLENYHQTNALKCKKCIYEYAETDIGRKIEQNKIRNQAQALRNIRKKNDNIKDGISMLDEMAQALDAPLDYLEIMGIEGNAARVCFINAFI